VRRTALVSLPVLALAVTGAALAPPSAGATSGSSSLSFGVPRVVDPIHVYGEPDIAVNPKTGVVHASGPQGTGTQRSIYNISVDGGDSYRILQNLPMNTDRAVLTAGTRPRAPWVRVAATPRSRSPTTARRSSTTWPAWPASPR